MAQRNDSTIWHLTQLGGASLLNAEYASHHFSPHYHEELAIGVIQSGKLTVQIGKHSRMTLGSGDIVVINPGEIHEGFTEGHEGCIYRMFYLPAKLLGKATGAGEEFHPHFAECAIRDALPAKQLTWLHRNLTGAELTVAEYESHLLVVINNLITHYAESAAPTLPHLAPNEAIIRQTQAILAANCHQKINLESLSAQVGLSPYHLLRTFKEAVGMTPHDFQMQMRIDQAKIQLLQGGSIANIAVDLGFHDQSHLTKHFKAVVGISPQRYRQHSNFLQDNRTTIP